MEKLVSIPSTQPPFPFRHRCYAIDSLLPLFFCPLLDSISEDKWTNAKNSRLIVSISSLSASTNSHHICTCMILSTFARVCIDIFQAIARSYSGAVYHFVFFYYCLFLLLLSFFSIRFFFFVICFTFSSNSIRRVA